MQSDNNNNIIYLTPRAEMKLKYKKAEIFVTSVLQISQQADANWQQH
jgi:hypothetical protein